MDMVDNDSRDRIVSRRPYLKLVGAGLATGLAGCMGGDDSDGNGGNGNGNGNGGNGNGNGNGNGGNGNGGNGNGNGNGNGGNGNGNGNETGNESGNGGNDSDGSEDIEGQSFSFWSVDWSQSEAAEAYVDDTVDQFESDTGATVDIRKAENPAGNQQVWVQAFENNDYPHVFEAGANVGTMVGMGVVKPVSDYIDLFSDEFREQFEPWLELAAAQFKGTDQSEAILPLFGDARSPMVTRRSFYEDTPGLEPDDFPPESYDEFLEQCRTLQEDGPVDFGTLIFGAGGDILDNQLPVWAFQEGGPEDGAIFSSDWEDVQFDNDTWIEAFTKYCEVYTEHELSPPFTPNAEDEQMGALLREGRIGMGWHELFTFPNIKEQVPEIIDDLMYGSMWGSEEYPEAVARANISGFCFTEPPDGEDADEWEEAQRVAAQYIEQTYGAVEYQVQASQDYGRLPLREDSWDDTEQLAEDNDNVVIPTMFEILDTIRDTEFVGQNHPRNIAISYTDVPPSLQAALQGEVSPEEACINAAEAARERM